MNCLISETSFGILAVEELGSRRERRVGCGIVVAVARAVFGFRWGRLCGLSKRALSSGYIRCGAPEHVIDECGCLDVNAWYSVDALLLYKDFLLPCLSL